MKIYICLNIQDLYKEQIKSGNNSFACDKNYIEFDIDLTTLSQPERDYIANTCTAINSQFNHSSGVIEAVIYFGERFSYAHNIHNQQSFLDTLNKEANKIKLSRFQKITKWFTR